MLHQEELSYSELPDYTFPSAKSRGNIAQTAFAVIGFGVVAIYIQSSKDCAENLKCIDSILKHLPKNYRIGTLIVCGGLEFGMGSALCSMESIPGYIELLDQHNGIKKFIIGGGVLLAAGLASLEQLFVAIKAFPTLSEALAAPTTWITLVSAYPYNLYGALNFVKKDIPMLVSKINQARGRYQGRSIIADRAYQQLLKEYQQFKVCTEKKWAALIPHARTIAINEDEKPLHFLYKTQLPAETKSTDSNTWIKTVTTSALAFGGLIASIGSTIPPIVNTYHFLKQEFAKDNHSIGISLGIGMLSTLIGLARIRTLTEKTIRGAVNLASWRPSQDLEYQLNPKITITSWSLGIPMAYFSYAVLKNATLNNFTGPYQQPIAEVCGYSVESSHLAFSFQLMSLLLTRFSGHYLYQVQKVVKEDIAKMTLEQFEHFVDNLTPEECELFKISKPVLAKKRFTEDTIDTEASEETFAADSPTSTEGSMFLEDGIISNDDEERSIIVRRETSNSVKPTLFAQTATIPTSNPTLKSQENPIKEIPTKRWALKLCCWWNKANNSQPSPNSQNENQQTLRI